MKRIEIVRCFIEGQEVKVRKDGWVGAFKPQMRVEVTAKSKLKTAIAVNRDGAGNYTARRIEEGGELTLKAVSNDYLFLHPLNLVQIVWTHQGALKIMSFGVIRRHNQVKVVEHVVFNGPILPQSEDVIFIPGAKSWEDLLRIAREAEILPQVEIKTSYSAKPKIPTNSHEAVVYWWNPLLKGHVTENGQGGNGYGQALLVHQNKYVIASFAASNFLNGIPEELKRGTIIEYQHLEFPSQHGGHNPRITGVKVKT